MKVVGEYAFEGTLTVVTSQGLVWIGRTLLLEHTVMFDFCQNLGRLNSTLVKSDIYMEAGRAWCFSYTVFVFII